MLQWLWLFILLYLIKPISSMSLHTRTRLLSAYSEQQGFHLDRWLNSCWLDLAWRDAQMFFKKRTQDASKLLCIKAFLSRRMLVTESWVISPHFLFFFQYNSAKAFQTFASLCFSLMNTKHDVSLIELLHRGCFYTTQIYYLSVPFLLFWINLVQRDSKTNKVCSLWPGSR